MSQVKIVCLLLVIGTFNGVLSRRPALTLLDSVDEVLHSLDNLAHQLGKAVNTHYLLREVTVKGTATTDKSPEDPKHSTAADADNDAEYENANKEDIPVRFGNHYARSGAFQGLRQPKYGKDLSGSRFGQWNKLDLNDW